MNPEQKTKNQIKSHMVFCWSLFVLKPKPHLNNNSAVACAVTHKNTHHTMSKNPGPHGKESYGQPTSGKFTCSSAAMYISMTNYYTILLSYYTVLFSSYTISYN